MSKEGEEVKASEERGGERWREREREIEREREGECQTNIFWQNASSTHFCLSLNKTNRK